MSELMANASTIFTTGVSFLEAFSNGTVDALDVIFALFGGMVALAMVSYAKNIVR